ncbi:hypothetical protein EON65_18870 [archaeon]|nr:MAG: hypothetical protein EON65_18870 [archaeon]
MWSREFLQKQRYKTNAATVFQGIATMIMARRGPTSNGKLCHISICYYFIKDRIESGKAKLEYLGTKDMISDTLAKLLRMRARSSTGATEAIEGTVFGSVWLKEFTLGNYVIGRNSSCKRVFTVLGEYTMQCMR